MDEEKEKKFKEYLKWYKEGQKDTTIKALALIALAITMVLIIGGGVNNAFFILLALAAALICNYVILVYRIRTGLFGNNEYEARSFMLAILRARKKRKPNLPNSPI